MLHQDDVEISFRESGFAVLKTPLKTKTALIYILVLSRDGVVIYGFWTGNWIC
jgi:hypothetical protein